MTRTDEFRSDIQGLRAIAVVAVVLFHVGLPGFDGGYLGVDIFFVISGFLITRNIRSRILAGRFSFPEFYVRRGRRIFPALLVTVTLTFTTSAIILSPPLLANFAKSAIAALLSVSNVYFWSDSGYFDTQSILKPLLHTWSLGVEEQFYLVWPLVMVLAARISDRAMAMTLALLAAISFAAGLVWQQHQTTLFFWMPFRVFELAIGGLCVWIVEFRKLPRSAGEPLAWAGLGLVVYPVLAFTETTRLPLGGLVPSLGVAMVIVGRSWLLRYLIGNPVVAGIGTASYSTYLVHWPLIVLYGFAVDRKLIDGERYMLTIASLVLGAAMFRLVEERFRYIRPTSQPPVRYALGCVAASILIIVPALTAASTGWLWRLGDRAQAYADPNGMRYGGTGCRPHRCTNGISTGRPIYVMGDSHARAYYAGLVQRYPNRPIIVFESSACSFFSLDYRAFWLDKADYGPSCRNTRRQAFAELRSAGDFDLIVAQSWNAIDMISKTGEVVALKRNDAFAAFADRELAAMKNVLRPHRMIVVGNVPTSGNFPTNPHDCVGRLLDHVDCTTVAMKDAWVIKNRRALNHMIAAGLPLSIRFIDPYDALCAGDTCHNIIGGRYMYSDWDHLSVWGSRYVVEHLFNSSEAASTIAGTPP